MQGALILHQKGKTLEATQQHRAKNLLNQLGTVRHKLLKEDQAHRAKKARVKVNELRR